jgi:hypothetical protein
LGKDSGDTEKPRSAKQLLACLSALMTVAAVAAGDPQQGPGMRPEPQSAEQSSRSVSPLGRVDSGNASLPPTAGSDYESEEDCE